MSEWLPLVDYVSSDPIGTLVQLPAYALLILGPVMMIRWWMKRSKRKEATSYT